MPECSPLARNVEHAYLVAEELDVCDDIPEVGCPPPHYYQCACWNPPQSALHRECHGLQGLAVYAYN